MGKLYAQFNELHSGDEQLGENIKKIIGGGFIEVESISMGQSNATISLKGLNKELNSIFFMFEDENGNEVDIYRDKRYSSYAQL